MQLATQPNKEPAPVQTAKRAMLASVTRGRIVKPYRIVVYGPEGVGKSTFAAAAPNPVFLGAEDGTSELDVTRLPQPRDWSDANAAVDELRHEPHNFGTLAVDTLDWMEPLCWQEVCDEAKKPNIEALGYGKGYLAALDKWREFLGKLTDLRDARSMYIVLLAHSQIRTFRNPEDEDFDRFEMKLHGKSAGLIREWCDALLFANYETLAYKSGDRVRGVSSGARFIHTERRPAFDAKNRQGLPSQLPLSWDDFIAAAKIGAPLSVEALNEQLAELMQKVDGGTREKAVGWLAKAGDDAQKLAQIADRLRAKVDTNSNTNTENK